MRFFLLALVKLCLPYYKDAVTLTVITLFTYILGSLQKSNHQYFYKQIETQVVYCHIGAVFYMNYYIYLGKYKFPFSVIIIKVLVGEDGAR